MWISGKELMHEVKELRGALAECMHERRGAEATTERLLVENERMRADLNHLMLRVNQVEKERQMLMLDRLGIKIPVPEFVAAENMPDELDAFNGMPDMTLVGDDAPAGFNPATELGPDYSGMPTRANN